MIRISDECVSCNACVNVCPTKCISLDNCNNIVIEENRCIQCNKCSHVCQIEQKTLFKKTLSTYAVIHRDEKKSFESSSTGIANMLYETVIRNNGRAFGTAMIGGNKPVLLSANNTLDLYEFKKSKYCFSDTNSTFSECEKYCKRGEKVIYIALPCQIAGLKLYLQKEYPNLVTVDILCHGAPPFYMFINHIIYLQTKHQSKVVNYSFRDKKGDRFGPYNYIIQFENGMRIEGPAVWDAYYSHFIKGSIFRKCCYNCKYAQPDRVGDITIGDFWYASSTIPELKTQKYISSVMINSEKGLDLWNECKNDFYYYNSNLIDLEKSTHAIKESASCENQIDIEKLKDVSNYIKWAKNYERSFNILLRKIKYKIIRL